MNTERKRGRRWLRQNFRSILFDGTDDGACFDDELPGIVLEGDGISPPPPWTAARESKTPELEIDENHDPPPSTTWPEHPAGKHATRRSLSILIRASH